MRNSNRAPLKLRSVIHFKLIKMCSKDPYLGAEKMGKTELPSGF